MNEKLHLKQSIQNSIHEAWQISEILKPKTHSLQIPHSIKNKSPTDFYTKYNQKIQDENAAIKIKKNKNPPFY